MKEEHEVKIEDLWIMVNYTQYSKYWAGFHQDGNLRQGMHTRDAIKAQMYPSEAAAKQHRIEYRKLYPMDVVQDIRIQRVTDVVEDEDARTIMLEKYKESLRESAAN